MCLCEIKILSRLNLVKIFNVIALYILFSFLKTRMHSSRMHTDRDSGHVVGCLPRQPPGQTPHPGQIPPPPLCTTPPSHIFLVLHHVPLHHTPIYNTSPVSRMKHACESITFPATRSVITNFCMCRVSLHSVEGN